MSAHLDVHNLSRQPICLRQRTRQTRLGCSAARSDVCVEPRGLGVLPLAIDGGVFSKTPAVELSIGQAIAGETILDDLPSWLALHSAKASWTRIRLQSASRRGPREGRSGAGNEKAPLLEKLHGRADLSAEDPSSYQLFVQKTAKGRWKLLVVPDVSPADHLSGLSEGTSIADLILPATHNTLALHGYPVSKCQDSDCMLDVQLNEGIRFVDIRIAERNGVLLAYHGPFPQLVPFRDMLQQAYAFLAAHSRETLIFCIQQEAPPSPRFSPLVRADMQDGIDRGLWFLEDRVPALGEVRGRIILMSRFGGNNDGGNGPWMSEEDGVPVLRRGWAPDKWPNSEIEGFEWSCGGTLVRVQDWYDIYGFFNIPAKASVLTDHLAHSAAMPPGSNMCISFASATSFPLALPPFVAKGFGWPRWGLGFTGVNEHLRDWVLEQIDRQARKALALPIPHDPPYWRLRGAIPMDFYRNAELVDVLIAYNGLYAE